MTTQININQVGRGVTMTIGQETVIANTPELITTTGTGTWTKPEGVTRVLVECWGGGGAGGGASTNQTGGDGGAGGQYARKLITYNSTQQNISYSVAATVTGGTGNGLTGNDTTWDTNVIIAKGGAGGLGNQTFGSGTPGSTTGGVGDIVYAGAGGMDGSGGPLGQNQTYGAGGAGGGGAGSNGNGLPNGVGNSEFGGDGGAATIAIDTGGVNGNSGNNYGGGGSGAGKVTGTSRSGGNGAQGLIRITTYNISKPGVQIQSV